MIASKVTITSSTMEALTHKLSDKQRIKLRRQAVLDAIRSQPAGTIITKTALVATAGYNSLPCGQSFLRRMLKDNIIREIKENPKDMSGSWEIVADVKVVKNPQLVPKAPQQFKELNAVKWTPPIAPPNNKNTILAKAKDFSWARNSDSLREFIAWLQETEVR